MGEKLSSRQQEILDMLLKGTGPKEIAHNLHISYNTLLTHQKKLYRKLGVNSLQELITRYSTGLTVAAEQGLVQVDGNLPSTALRTFPAVQKNWLTGKWWGGFLCGIIASVVILLVVLFLGRQTHAGTANETPALITHSFDTLHLRALRWNNYYNPYTQDTPAHGENWSAQLGTSVTDLPAHISRFTLGNNHTITISGTSNQDLDFFVVRLFGVTKSNDRFFFGATDLYIQIKANSPFNETYPVRIFSECNLADFQVIELSFDEELLNISDVKPDQSRINGSLPEDIPDGTIMATISDFKITLNDTRKTPVTR